MTETTQRRTQNFPICLTSPLSPLFFYHLLPVLECVHALLVLCWPWAPQRPHSHCHFENGQNVRIRQARVHTRSTRLERTTPWDSTTLKCPPLLFFAQVRANNGSTAPPVATVRRSQAITSLTKRRAHLALSAVHPWTYARCRSIHFYCFGSHKFQMKSCPREFQKWRPTNPPMQSYLLCINEQLIVALDKRFQASRIIMRLSFHETRVGYICWFEEKKNSFLSYIQKFVFSTA